MKLAACALSVMTWLMLAAPAMAECVTAPDWTPEAALADRALGPTRNDRRGRVVAPVTINGQGPYRFIVDTGANRSALSAALASQLALPSQGTGEVHSVYGVSTAQLVGVNALHYRDLSLPTSPMPILSTDVLAGEQGLLGVDGMQGRRLLMDFERRCIEIAPSRGGRFITPGWTSIPAQLRFGHLIVLRGRIAGIDVNVLLDTGSDSTLVNARLRDMLASRTRRLHSQGRSTAYTAGEPIVLDQFVAIRRIRIGDLEVRDVLAFAGDFYIFRLWELTDEPTLLMGMDVLSQAGALSIDYGRSTVQFRARRGSRGVR